MLSLDKGLSVFLILLDLSAASDTVNHSLLLARLQKSFGIRGIALQWFDSYLSQRTRFVNINEVNSTVRDLPMGVPQGSVLGPCGVLGLVESSRDNQAACDRLS